MITFEHIILLVVTIYFILSTVSILLACKAVQDKRINGEREYLKIEKTKMH